jgi:hypothetical protein
MTGTTMSGTSDLVDRLRLGEGSSPDHALLIDAADAIAKLRHDLANAQCAANLMSEAYDRMVLKYEARIVELERTIGI